MNITLAIKNRLTINQVANYYGINYKGKKISCPFPGHEDKTPSFKLFVKTNTFKCYGCGKQGDIIDLAMYLFNINNTEAMKKLDADFNLQIIGKDIDKKTKEKIKQQQEKIRLEREKEKRKEDLMNKYAENYRKCAEICEVLSPIYPNEPCEAWLMCNELMIMYEERIDNYE